VENRVGSYREPKERDRLIRRAKMLSWLSLGWMTVEGAAGIVAALRAGSSALLGFGIDSAIEGLASMTVIWRFTGRRRLSASAEKRARRLVAIGFLLLAPYIGRGAVRTLIAGRHPSSSGLGIVLSASSMVLMPLMGRSKRSVGRHLGSAATVGEGSQNMLCAYMAGGVLIGMLANTLLGAWWLDPIVAIGIACLAVREGVEAWGGEHCGCATIPGLDDSPDDCAEHAGG
jgi:divalent metal cation (Fe/Co/Zn/Cd) transporter